MGLSICHIALPAWQSTPRRRRKRASPPYTGPGLTGFVSTVVILELQHTLKRVYGARRAQLMAVLEALVQHPFIALENEKQVLAAMATAASKNCGFQDCLLVETAALHGAFTTYTFDKQTAKRAGMRLLG